MLVNISKSAWNKFLKRNSKKNEESKKSINSKELVEKTNRIIKEKSRNKSKELLFTKRSVERPKTRDLLSRVIEKIKNEKNKPKVKNTIISYSTQSPFTKTKKSSREK